MTSLAVTVPTRNRPEKLRRCLSALAQARGLIPFEVYVGDSSDEVAVREAVQMVCDEFELVHMFRHDGIICLLYAPSVHRWLAKSCWQMSTTTSMSTLMRFPDCL